MQHAEPETLKAPAPSRRQVPPRRATRPPARFVTLASARGLLFAALLVPTLLACEAPPPEPAVELTRRQKDSVVARSGLPGARGVEKALNVLEASEDRAAAIEEATR